MADTKLVLSKSRFQKPLKLLGVAFIVLLLALFAMITTIRQELSKPPEVVLATKRANPDLVALKESGLFMPLRYADLLGNHFAMIKHTPSSQRLVFLSSNKETGGL